MFTLLRQRRLRWIGHARRMADGRIPKDLLYSELSLVKRKRGRPLLRFTDVCKRDMKACDIDTVNWELQADDRKIWKAFVHNGLAVGEGKLKQQTTAK